MPSGRSSSLAKKIIPSSPEKISNEESKENSIININNSIFKKTKITEADKNFNIRPNSRAPLKYIFNKNQRAQCRSVPLPEKNNDNIKWNLRKKDKYTYAEYKMHFYSDDADKFVRSEDKDVAKLIYNEVFSGKEGDNVPSFDKLKKNIKNIISKEYRSYKSVGDEAGYKKKLKEIQKGIKWIVKVGKEKSEENKLEAHSKWVGLGKQHASSSASSDFISGCYRLTRKDNSQLFYLRNNLVKGHAGMLTHFKSKRVTPNIYNMGEEEVLLLGKEKFKELQSFMIIPNRKNCKIDTENELMDYLKKYGKVYRINHDTQEMEEISVEENKGEWLKMLMKKELPA